MRVTKAEQRRERRRRILSGFPVQDAFKTIEDVRHYLSGDRIQCLLCGQWRCSLGVHLTRIHSMEPDAYREQYNIPWTYALDSQTTSGRKREAAMLAVDLESLPERASAARAAWQAQRAEGAAYRPLQPCVAHLREDVITRANQSEATIACSDCGGLVVVVASQKKRSNIRCPDCRYVKYGRFTEKSRERIARWMLKNPERARHYNAARQRYFHGNPQPLKEYAETWKANPRVLKTQCG